MKAKLMQLHIYLANYFWPIFKQTWNLWKNVTLRTLQDLI